MRYETLDSILDVGAYMGLAAGATALITSNNVPAIALTIDMFQSLQVNPLIWRGTKKFIHEKYDWYSDMFFPVVTGYPHL